MTWGLDQWKRAVLISESGLQFYYEKNPNKNVMIF